MAEGSLQLRQDTGWRTLPKPGGDKPKDQTASTMRAAPRGEAGSVPHSPPASLHSSHPESPLPRSGDKLSQLVISNCQTLFPMQGQGAAVFLALPSTLLVLLQAQGNG